MPDLGDIDFVLLTGPRAPGEAADALTTAIMGSGSIGMVPSREDR
jgi:hypothetical protein